MNFIAPRSVQCAGLLLIAVFALAVGRGMMAEVPSEPRTQASISSKMEKRTLASRSRPESIKMKKFESDLTGPATAPVIVAVIDTGFDPQHLRLKSHQWHNPGETGWDIDGRRKNSNGIDDDANGFVDDAHGFDFVGGRNPIIDTHGHGTHIAGIIAKQAPRARLMNLKYFDREIDGVAALRNSIEAIKYAIAMKADIINYSGGGVIPSQEELIVLEEASRRGILIVAAAGNEGSNSERQPFYPANYKLTNILSVTAIDTIQSDTIVLPTSNFGARSVAVAAPGKDVVSTLPGNRYGAMTGTSQATAFATAVAAEIISESRERNETISPEEVIERIVISSRVSPNLKGKTRLGSRLEGRRALAFRSESQTKKTETEKNQFLRAFEAELLRPESQASVNPLSNR